MCIVVLPTGRCAADERLEHGRVQDVHFVVAYLSRSPSPNLALADFRDVFPRAGDLAIGIPS